MRDLTPIKRSECDAELAGEGLGELLLNVGLLHAVADQALDVLDGLASDANPADGDDLHALPHAACLDIAAGNDAGDHWVGSAELEAEELFFEVISHLCAVAGPEGDVDAVCRPRRMRVHEHLGAFVDAGQQDEVGGDESALLVATDAAHRDHGPRQRTHVALLVGVGRARLHVVGLAGLVEIVRLRMGHQRHVAGLVRRVRAGTIHRSGAPARLRALVDAHLCAVVEAAANQMPGHLNCVFGAELDLVAGHGESLGGVVRDRPRGPSLGRRRVHFDGFAELNGAPDGVEGHVVAHLLAAPDVRDDVIRNARLRC
mmetsp:Transcript_65919/g.129686  ORF Transcript_65919/g.129686 Transcript_65919/m.129686 type:complete len:315 (+) Transcript_65919:353-1297(+)